MFIMQYYTAFILVFKLLIDSTWLTAKHINLFVHETIEKKIISSQNFPILK